jgi:hypothetical protein
MMLLRRGPVGLLVLGQPMGFRDILSRRDEKKQKESFKEELHNLANKPAFTFMDYKFRIVDTLTKSKSGIRSLLSQDQEETNEQL